jgi:hypothetical protein
MLATFFCPNVSIAVFELHVQFPSGTSELAHGGSETLSCKDRTVANLSHEAPDIYFGALGDLGTGGRHCMDAWNNDGLDRLGGVIVRM